MVMLDLEFMASTFKYVLSAIPMTLMLTLVPLVLGLVIGVSLCIIRIKKVPVASGIVSVFYHRKPHLSSTASSVLTFFIHTHNAKIIV